MNQSVDSTAASDAGAFPEAMQPGAPVPEGMAVPAAKRDSDSMLASARPDSGHTAAPNSEPSAAAETDLRWIMREACWSRMFGKASAKNPFTK
jgi:hypothetical protein